MKLEDQVCSLELAKKLKELGVKQENATFNWFDDHGTIYVSDKFKPFWAAAAFTVAELGEMLKGVEFDSGFRKSYCFCEVYDANGKKTSKEDSSEANARAVMLVHLIERKLIEVPK